MRNSQQSSQRTTASNDTAWLNFLRTAGNTLPEHTVQKPLPCTCAGKLPAGWEQVQTPEGPVYIDHNTNTVSRHDPRCSTSYEICYTRQRYMLATTGNVLLPEEGPAPDGALWCATFNAMADHHGSIMRKLLPPPAFPGSPSREKFFRYMNRYRKGLVVYKAKYQAGVPWLRGFERDGEGLFRWMD
ncbi:hypothetical protein LTR10_015744 [Elasticomyces elasticus]|nr:hypothetical protein LTR10_015744 [Elasticomyces elasticus]KAK4975427.1 hypothetical protein LTR42_004637 [Elasticomyces elasticus]